MVFFYLIHHLPWGEGIEATKRNCRTFLFGVALYCVVALVAKNLQMTGASWISGLWSMLQAVGLTVLLADVCVMAYLYRYSYGRSILEEIAPEKESSWVWDERESKWRSISLAERKERDLEHVRVLEEHRLREAELLREVQRQQEELQQRQLAEVRKTAIQRRKREIAAARMIQRWWRDLLYRPGTGRVYLRASREFNQLASSLS